MTRRLFVGLALLLGACGSGPVMPDGGIGDGGGARQGVLRLGEGERDFRAIEDGDTLEIARGCQGSQHVWITLRSEDMDPRGMIVELQLVRASDEREVSDIFRLRLSFTEDASGAFAQLTGLTLQVPDPDALLGEGLILRGRIEDRDGVEASAERRVQIVWGTSVCEEAG